MSVRVCMSVCVHVCVCVCVCVHVHQVEHTHGVYVEVATETLVCLHVGLGTPPPMTPMSLPRLSLPSHSQSWLLAPC